MSKTGRLFLTETQEQYLEWLLQPADSRTPKTKKEWSEQHDVHYNTVGQWEKNKNFQERWNLGVKGLTQSPERAQALLDALFIKGIAGDTKSAELYLKATGQMPNAAQQINIKSEIEQIIQTRKINCFFKPCSITKIFCAPIANIKLKLVKKPSTRYSI